MLGGKNYDGDLVGIMIPVPVMMVPDLKPYYARLLRVDVGEFVSREN